MSPDFTKQLKNQKGNSPRVTSPSSIADTFKGEPPQRVHLHRTTINIPVDLHDQMRREAFETGVSMTDQLINAWKAQRGL